MSGWDDSYKGKIFDPNEVEEARPWVALIRLGAWVPKAAVVELRRGRHPAEVGDGDVTFGHLLALWSERRDDRLLSRRGAVWDGWERARLYLDTAFSSRAETCTCPVLVLDGDAHEVDEALRLPRLRVSGSFWRLDT